MNKLNRQTRADLGLAVITLGISVVVFWNASALPSAPFDPLGPKTFPMGIAAVLAFVSIIAIFRVLVGAGIGRSEISIIQGIGDDAPTDYALRPWLAVAAALLTIAYVGVMSLTNIGFLWATIIFMSALGFLMSDRTKAHAITAVVIAVVAGFAVSFLFTKIFIVDLP